MRFHHRVKVIVKINESKSSMRYYSGTECGALDPGPESEFVTKDKFIFTPLRRIFVDGRGDWKSNRTE